jgi:hypothetical protein
VQAQCWPTLVENPLTDELEGKKDTEEEEEEEKDQRTEKRRQQTI